MSVWREQVQIYLLAPQWTATLNTVLVCWVASHSLNFLMNVWTCRWFREATSTSAWMNLNIDFSERTEIGPIIHKMCVCGVTRTMNYNWIRLLKDIVSKKKNELQAPRDMLNTNLITFFTLSACFGVSLLNILSILPVFRPQYLSRVILIAKKDFSHQKCIARFSTALHLYFFCTEEPRSHVNSWLTPASCATEVPGSGTS